MEQNSDGGTRIASESTYTMTLLSRPNGRGGGDDFFSRGRMAGGAGQGTAYGAGAGGGAESEAAAVRKSDLWTRREAAEYLGVCEQTLAAWKTRGLYGLPVVKIGRMVRYRKKYLDDFIQRRTEAS